MPYITGKPLMLWGVSYRRGAELPAKAVESLKRAALAQLLSDGRIMRVEGGRAISRELAASSVNVREA